MKEKTLNLVLCCSLEYSIHFIFHIPKQKTVNLSRSVGIAGKFPPIHCSETDHRFDRQILNCDALVPRHVETFVDEYEEENCFKKCLLLNLRKENLTKVKVSQ